MNLARRGGVATRKRRRRTRRVAANRRLAALADAVRAVADRACAVVEDALAFVAASERRIAKLKAGSLDFQVLSPASAGEGGAEGAG